MLSVPLPPSVHHVQPAPRRVIPEGWEEFPCACCRQIILARSDTPETPICRECLRGEAIRDIGKAAETFKALRKGSAPFDVLTPQERAEQLAAMLIGDDGPPPPTPVRASMRVLSDSQLINVVAESNDLAILGAACIELARRLGLPLPEPTYDSEGYQPSPEERDEIESRIELDEQGDQLAGDRWDDAA